MTQLNAKEPTPQQRMVDNQLRPNRVTSPRVLEAFVQVERRDFLPQSLHAIAYSDQHLQLAENEQLVEPAPLTLATLIHEADIQPTDTVLLTGAVSGYAAAIVSYLASSVVVACMPTAASEQIQKHLEVLDLPTMPAVTEADIHIGYQKGAPFDVIIVLTAVALPLPALEEQLSQAAGRLVFVFRANTHAPGQLRVVTREGDLWAISPKGALDAVLNAQSQPEQTFVF